MLDLFDLDEAFSSEEVRLAQLTNKCKLFYIGFLFLIQISVGFYEGVDLSPGFGN